MKKFVLTKRILCEVTFFSYEIETVFFKKHFKSRRFSNNSDFVDDNDIITAIIRIMVMADDCTDCVVDDDDNVDYN